MRGLAQGLGELARRRALRRVVEDFHVGQRRCIEAVDPRDGELAELVCLLTHRRWGKTEGLLRHLCDLCLHPTTHVHGPAICAYVNQEREYAQDLAWPILVNLLDQYGWNATLDNRGMVVRFKDTGATLKLYGADQKRWQRRMRGKQFDGVAIDEAQDFVFSDLEHLCMRVLYPALADRHGRLWMAGTPGEVENYFYEVQDGFDAEEVEDGRTQPVVSKRHPMWVVVRGDYLENPHTRPELQGQINRLNRANPQIEQEPWFQREYLSIWKPDTRNRVVKISPHLNYMHEWTRQPEDRFVLGIDFGFPDYSAYVLLTWNPERYPFFVYIDGWAQKSMEIHEHVTAIREYMLNYPGIRIVGDPSWFGGKDSPSTEALVTELNQIHGLPVEPADKKDKRFHVERMNSEASCGWLKIFNSADPSCPEDSPMAKQWNNLVRHKDGSEGTPRHLHDAGLYARRAAAPWAFRGKVQEEDSDAVIREQMRGARFGNLKKRRESRSRRRSYN